jgi:hypothetical protein
MIKTKKSIGLMMEKVEKRETSSFLRFARYDHIKEGGMGEHEKQKKLDSKYEGKRPLRRGCVGVD